MQPIAPTGWSTGDVALIAAAGAVLAASIAAIGAFVSALVNVWSARVGRSRTMELGEPRPAGEPIERSLLFKIKG